LACGDLSVPQALFFRIAKFDLRVRRRRIVIEKKRGWSKLIASADRAFCSLAVLASCFARL
jgi:hypothetical protein